jgi:hypothetical protein
VFEIAVAVGGLILAVLAYVAGVRHGKRYREEDRAAAAEHEADHRIDRVVQRYARLVQTSQTGALHGLLVAGVKNLRSSGEVRLARERATAQTGIDPLLQYSLDGVDLKASRRLPVLPLRTIVHRHYFFFRCAVLPSPEGVPLGADEHGRRRVLS